MFTVDWNKFHIEVQFLKHIFTKNSYPMHFIDKCIKTFLNKTINPITVPGDEKRELNISLPFMGKYSNEIKKKISRLSSKVLINTKVNIIWNSPRKLRNLFTFKDQLPMRFRSNILYVQWMQLN